MEVRDVKKEEEKEKGGAGQQKLEKKFTKERENIKKRKSQVMHSLARTYVLT